MARPSPTAVVAGAVLGTRLPILLLGAIAVTIVGTVPPPAAEAVWRVSSHELTNMLARWDTFFYYSIATGRLPLGPRRSSSTRTWCSFRSIRC